MNSGKASIVISVSFLLVMALIMPQTGFGSTASSDAKPHANTDPSIAKTITAALAMGVVTYWCRDWVYGWAGPLGGMAKVYNVGIPVFVGIASYTFFSVLLRSRELGLVWASISRRSQAL